MVIIVSGIHRHQKYSQKKVNKKVKINFKINTLDQYIERVAFTHYGKKMQQNK